MTRILVVYNEKSGSSDKEALQKAFTATGLQPDYIAINSRSLKPTLETLRSDPKAIIVAAGGDGTINSVAANVMGGACALGIMPLGTLNHFAKAVKIPQDLPQAAQVIAQGATTQVDIGSVNSRVFVNNASIGFYPRSLRFREEYTQKIGKWPAAAIGLAHAMLHPRRYAVDIVVNGSTQSLKTPFVFIGNNEYQRSGMGLSGRASLHEGILALYVIKKTQPVGIFRALLHTFLTKKRRAHDFAIHKTTTATIHSNKYTKLRVACDGESFLLRTPLRFASHPGALRVIIPKG